MINPRILYFFTVTLCSLFIYDSLSIVIIFIANVFVWVIALPVRDFFISLRRYMPFFFFIAISYALLGEFDEDMFFVESLKMGLNFTGLISGTVMALRVYNIILASLILRRSGTSGNLYAVMRSVRIPDAVAIPVDVTSSLLELRFSSTDENKRESRKRERGRMADVVSLFKGDISPILHSIARGLSNTRRIILERNPAIKDEQLRELSVIACLSFLIMSIRMIKILPGIPFAPGHKGIIIIPFYILAHELSGARWGSTKTGFTAGIISLFMGFGKFGVFELSKHVMPGLFVDVALPVTRGIFKKGSYLVYCFLGIMISVFRFSTLLIVTLLASPPKGAYYMLVFIFVSHIIAGAMSGFITYPLLKSISYLESSMKKDITQDYQDSGR